MSAILRTLTLAAAAVACFDANCGDVVVNPSRSRLWSTVTEQSVTIPVPWPEAADSAKLVAPAVGEFAGVNVDLVKGRDSACQLSLPRPVDAESEYVVSLSLEFFNAQGDALSPKLETSLGVVCALPRFDGTDVQSKQWKEFYRRSSVVPVVDGAKFFVAGLGATSATNHLPDICAWTMFTHRDSGDYAVSLMDESDAVLGVASLKRLPSGLIMTFR